MSQCGTHCGDHRCDADGGHYDEHTSDPTAPDLLGRPCSNSLSSKAGMCEKPVMHSTALTERRTGG